MRFGQRLIFQADRHEFGFGSDMPQHSGVAPVLQSVRDRVEAPPAVPTLVADAPQAYAPWLGAAILRPLPDES